MQTTGSIEIELPVDDVFRLTTECLQDWSQVVISDEVIDETPDGVGTTFRTVTEERGSRMEFTGEVTKYERPWSNAVHLTGTMFDIDVNYQFEAVNDSLTRVTQVSEVKGKGFFKVFLLLFGRLMAKSSCQATQKELERLKRSCEGDQ